jgi:SAM-dependent methyltransferase
MSQSRSTLDIAEGRRFAFGQNWGKFLGTIDQERIAIARDSLTSMLGVETLDGMRFLDAGSGSGLFSLAARKLGASVHSFDYDPASVASTMALKDAYFNGDPAWIVEEGSILDQAYMESLGEFDIVYSWGVLHHTGAMWTALGHVCDRAAPGGKLFVALYNDQGAVSAAWLKVKRLYNRSSRLGRLALVVGIGASWASLSGLKAVVVGRNPADALSGQKRKRGMSAWHDLIDWVGGYPFEVARPEEVLDFCVKRGFTLERLITVGGAHSNNQFVFRRA